MIKIVTAVNGYKLETSKTTCRNCHATVEFGCFVPTLCNRCRLMIPNYKSLVDHLSTRIEYYKKGTISGLSAY